MQGNSQNWGTLVDRKSTGGPDINTRYASTANDNAGTVAQAAIVTGRNRVGVMNHATIIAVTAAVLVLVAFAGFVFTRRRRTQTLRGRFGREYDRTVAQHGGTLRAENELEQREKRVRRMEIVPLTASARSRYTELWADVQHHFVDDPRAAVTSADDLVTDVMTARGYPSGEFEQRAADISVDHARVVEDYRTAHRIAQRNRRDEASTEDLRQAMVLYRGLFQELLGVEPEQREVA